jgi:hypothetical protein
VLNVSGEVLGTVTERVKIKTRLIQSV